METNDKIVVTGAGGVLGSALSRALANAGYTNVELLTSQKCNLLNLDQTVSFFKEAKPKYVFHLAGYVNGIMGNIKNKGISYFNNVYINTNTIEACRLAGVKKVVAMGTVAAYPNTCVTPPFKEEMIWNGYPHESEDSYGQAKRAMLAQLIAYKDSYGLDYAFVLSTNLYGPNDKFDKEYGHVIPSLVAKFHHAKLTDGRVSVWGNGLAERDFLYSDDAAQGLIKIAGSFTGAINLATGKVNKIKEVVQFLAECSGVGMDRVDWDTAKPNGQVVRLYDVSKLDALGVHFESSLQKGLQSTYEWYDKNATTARR